MHKKYDIGILTFWNVPNYGTFAQAYALQKVCERLFPNNETVQIAYLNERHYKSYYSPIPVCSVKSKRFWKELPSRLLPNSKYNRKKKLFVESYKLIPHTDDMKAADFKNTEFSSLIIGSDIVWDYSFDVFDHDEFLFGNGIKADKKIAYAASFGTVKKNDHYPPYVTCGINNMDYVSVRDVNSMDVVLDISKKSPPLVLDPTWLWDFSNDKNIPPAKYINYLVVYGQDFTEEFIKQIIEQAAKENLKIICLDCNNDAYSWCDIVIRQCDLSPFEWLSLFKYASIVATSTFHGLTFGLIFNKRLAFCKSKFILAKAEGFLKELHLYDFYMNTPDYIFANMAEYLDYEYINSYINRMRQSSIEYLKMSIGDCHGQ